MSPFYLFFYIQYEIPEYEMIFLKSPTSSEFALFNKQW